MIWYIYIYYIYVYVLDIIHGSFAKVSGPDFQTHPIWIENSGLKLIWSSAQIRVDLVNCSLKGHWRSGEFCMFFSLSSCVADFKLIFIFHPSSIHLPSIFHLLSFFWLQKGSAEPLWPCHERWPRARGTMPLWLHPLHGEQSPGRPSALKLSGDERNLESEYGYPLVMSK